MACKVLLVGLSAGVVLGCGGPQVEGNKPVPSLASSVEAQRDFRNLRDSWRGLTATGRGQLIPSLRAFVERYPNDGRTSLVRVYLALVLLEQRQLPQARKALVPLARLPEGTTRDLARVARALLLLSAGDPTQARRVLEPLRGKLIDADERLLYGELLVKTALLEGHLAEAVLDMRWWLTEVEPADVPEVKLKVLGYIANFNREQLEEARVWLSRERHESRAEQKSVDEWLARQVTEELARSALRDDDAELARRLVGLESGSISNQETRQRLNRLASSGELTRRIVGRTLGLVLSLGDSTSSGRAAQVSAGIMRALGLPRSQNAPEGIRLLVEQDAQGMRSALATLAGGGASVLVAGVEPEGAALALKFAEEAAIPVLTLAEPGAAAKDWQYAFSLATSEQEQQDTLLQAFKARGIQRYATYPSETSERCGSLVRAGQQRFPVQAWKQQRVEGLLLLLDERCSRDVSQALVRAGYAPLLAFGLEAAPLVFAGRAKQSRIGVGAGAYPASSGANAPALSWYEALGADAARLASSALEGFPSETVDDARVVAELHTRARDRLLSTSVELITTQSRGFDGRHQLPRQLHLVESSGR